MKYAGLALCLAALAGCGPSLHAQLRSARTAYLDHADSVQARYRALDDGYRAFRFGLSDKQAILLQRATDLGNESSRQSFLLSLNWAQTSELNACATESRALDRTTRALQDEALYILSLEEKLAEHERAVAAVVAGIEEGRRNFEEQQRAAIARRQQEEQQRLVDRLNSIDIQLQQLTRPRVIVVPR